MSGHHYAVEGRKADAVAHLAVARSQNTGNGILGILLKKKGSCESDCLFLSDEEKSKEPAYEYGYIMNII